MIPIQSWICESWQNSGQSEFWKRGWSAGKRRTVRRSQKLLRRGSAERSPATELYCGLSAIGPRTVRRSVSRTTADGPPMDRGQSAWGQLPRFLSAPADGPTMDCGRSARAQKDGVSLTWLIRECPFLLPHQTDHIHPKALSFLSQARGRKLQGGGCLLWFPDGPSASPNPSWDSPSCPLGISMIHFFMFLDFIMKEGRVWVLRSVFGPWIHENIWGILFLVMRRYYG